MCRLTTATEDMKSSTSVPGMKNSIVEADNNNQSSPSLDNKENQSNNLIVPSLGARYTCASILVGCVAVWGKYTFVTEETAPTIGVPMHSYKVPLFLTVFYLISLPLLRLFTTHFLGNVDVKILLKESMVIYNALQVLLNGWMVYRFVRAVLVDGHPFVGDLHNVSSGAAFATWVHYCDKYLEFFDTYFMVLRGKSDQISFLHVYHHTTIAWCWWLALTLWPGGDSYFGALLNSWIHVIMYSYYTLSLCKIPCPWKAQVTKCQLLQFSSVNVYTILSFIKISKLTDTKWNHYVCHMVQVFEMTSLFVLFMHFYRKKYSSKNKKNKNTTTIREKETNIKKIQSTASIASTADTVVTSASIEEVSES